ncbi:GNAT family N-acetyltransferase [uncultured Pontibacter sp.]|uniref:GNAT family N-acetyltransferase n=1 Tax=uncultured Pontibacter sp. TaxID=453356 RepID=UPI0026348EF5|nr:GNAT family N-acetyltransferase [uncultured Pontibacter sp.]
MEHLLTKNQSSEATIAEPFAVELLMGDAVYAALDKPVFQTAWDQLYESCSWGTVFQSRLFVASWYHIYCKQQEPVLIYARHENSFLGLMALTYDAESKVLTGAGKDEACYHVWLADSEFGDVFAARALNELISKFKDTIIDFNELPSDTPLSWLEYDAGLRERGVLQILKRPLMDFKAPNAARLISSNGIDSKLKRLKRLGDVSFERITCHDCFVSILDEINDQFDFRKGATLNLSPFKNEPLKKELQLALFRQGLLYVAVLRVGGQLVASVTGVIGRDNCINGFTNTYAPSYAKYSPGIVSFILLGKQLYNEGIAFYDLTTGGHGYKDRLANAYDEVYILQIRGKHARIVDETKALIRSNVKGLLQRIGVKPRVVRNDIRFILSKQKEQFRAISAAGAATAAQGLASRLGLFGKGYYYLLPTSGSLDAASGLRRASLSDLLNFGQRGGLLTRWDFLAQAERRLQAGQEPLTLSREGLLLCCVWLLLGGELEGLYCHRGREGELAGFLAAAAEYAGEGARVLVREPSQRRALKKAGFAIANA